MEIDTRKMKFYTKFEIIEKRAFAVIYGKKPSNLEFRSIFKSILAHIFFWIFSHPKALFQGSHMMKLIFEIKIPNSAYFLPKYMLSLRKFDFTSKNSCQGCHISKTAQQNFAIYTSFWSIFIKNLYAPNFMHGHIYAPLGLLCVACPSQNTV